MTHRIYKAICTVAVVVFLCSLALIMELLYNYFSAVHLKQMKELAGMTARGVELNGNSFFDDFSFDGCRITWIQSDGEVLFDNEANADHMENHLEREEVREAMTTGEGESSRYSKTLTERYVYVATALDDGSVIRIADTQYSVLTLLLGSMQPILIVLAIGLGLSFYLAWKLSKRIVKPLNEMDLDHPDEKLVSIVLYHDSLQNADKLCVLRYVFNTKVIDVPDDAWCGTCREHSDGRGYTFEYAMEWVAAGITPPKPGETRPNNWNIHFSNVGGMFCCGQIIENVLPDSQKRIGQSQLAYLYKSPLWGKMVFE